MQDYFLKVEKIDTTYFSGGILGNPTPWRGRAFRLYASPACGVLQGNRCNPYCGMPYCLPGVVSHRIIKQERLAATGCLLNSCLQVFWLLWYALHKQHIAAPYLLATARYKELP